MCWIWGEPGCRIAQISDEQQGTARVVEAAIHVQVFLWLFLGIGGRYGWELACLHTLKGIMEPKMCWIWGEPVQAAESLRFQMNGEVQQE